MSPTEDGDTRLDDAIAGVYGGPLEEFIRSREALAKQLRADGLRDDAATVKALRKPSRIAWALDRAVLDDEHALARLDHAVAATLEAQTRGGDIRAAIADLRTAVRAFAGHAARAAQSAGFTLDENTLTNAVQAVLGRADAFEALRHGRLADVPDAGGLDFLASLPVPTTVAPPLPPTAKPARPAAAPEPAPEPVPSRHAALEAAARETVRQTREGLAAARARADEASHELRDAEAGLAAAEEQLRQAETELRIRRAGRDRARDAAMTASTRRIEAERALAVAEERLAELAGDDSP